MIGIGRRWLQAGRARLPLHGHVPSPVPTPLLDALSDEELARLNGLLPWQAFVTDGRGRRFGDSAWKGKRDVPQSVPDPRILLMDRTFGLAGRSVLEIGCFEGVHTIGLIQCRARVKAVDARVENVAKTIVRCALFGAQPEVYLWDAEQAVPAGLSLDADFAHHVGVLYHLHDPVNHLLRLAPRISKGIMLDTHFANAEDATGRYVVDGIEYPHRSYREFGRDDVFSGMYPSSRWLLLEDLIAVLMRAGFRDVNVAEARIERNGPRALLFATK